MHLAKAFGRAGRLLLLGAIALGSAQGARAEDKPAEINVDYAYYNPASLVLKQKGWLEQDLAAEGIKVHWVLSLGSNKALEFLNAKSLDFGSSAGAAALLARINGNPVKAIYVYSKPEWTALLTKEGSPIHSLADLKGKRVAATRGTDPHIFLVRALASAGLAEKDVTVVPLQHQDGRLALDRGDVDAWAGLDPLMAQAELNDGARIFYRNVGFNSWGVLNTREDFAAAHPDIVRKVLQAYEKARAFSTAHPDELRAIIVEQTRLPEPVAARQLERTDLSTAAIGAPQKETIEEAGLALQKAGVIPASVDVPAQASALIDPEFTTALAIK